MGINLPEAKNMVGAFFQPLGVLIDTATLATLPDRRVSRRPGRSGQVRRDSRRRVLRLSRSQRRRIATSATGTCWPTSIARCCRLKADVVEQDEREESGLRAVLELRPHVRPRLRGAFRLRTAPARRGGGHRHGLRRPPGRAAGTRRRGLREASVATSCQLFNFPPIRPDVDTDELIEAMYHDKKIAQGELRFILPTGWATWNWFDGIKIDDILGGARERGLNRNMAGRTLLLAKPTRRGGVKSHVLAAYCSRLFACSCQSLADYNWQVSLHCRVLATAWPRC